MKNLFFLIFSISILNIFAQDKSEYINEAYALFKIKSFNTETNKKKCVISAYVKVAEKFKEATYYLELRPNDYEAAIFRETVDFNRIWNLRVASSYRQKNDVYEFNFGSWYIPEEAFLQLVIIQNDNTETKIPLEFINYKNRITIMN